METVEDYAERITQNAEAAIRMAKYHLMRAGTPMCLRAASDLERVRMDVDAMLEDALDADGLSTRMDPNDGLVYVVPEVAA